jgi:carbon-monoxide dehydrogenase small subunit
MMAMTAQKKITLTVNGRSREVETPANATLLETLRDLGYVEVKCGCEKGDCGACAVLVDGIAVDGCLTLTWTVEGQAITTVVGLNRADGKHPLIKSFEAARPA